MFEAPPEVSVNEIGTKRGACQHLQVGVCQFIFRDGSSGVETKLGFSINMVHWSPKDHVTTGLSQIRREKH
jgi:hypothetical protein